MSDGVGLAALPADLAEMTASRVNPPTSFNPANTKIFADMVRDGAPPLADTGHTGQFAQVVGKTVAEINHLPSSDELRQTMLQNIDFSDPLRSMVAVADYSRASLIIMTKLNITSSLASAATSTFGNLLRNQQ